MEQNKQNAKFNREQNNTREPREYREGRENREQNNAREQREFKEASQFDDFSKEDAHKDIPTIGITVGDGNGIGPELILRIIQEVSLFKLAKIVVYGNLQFFIKYKKLTNAPEFSFHIVAKDGQLNNKKANLISAWDDDFNLTPGVPSSDGGHIAALSLQAAVSDLKLGNIHAVVTAPINKAMMPEDVFPFPGHTEYFGEEFNAEPLMFLISDSLKVALVTGHTSVGNIIQGVTEQKIRKKIFAIQNSLKQDFAISKAKIAVLGLNPHAGDEGKIGTEENEIIKPLLDDLKSKGNLVFGPYPADGFFAAQKYKDFDAVLAMYHDQGLIPFKMLSFEDGVNYTAGLPIVRTSPDHGTAYSLVGQNTADLGSFRSAIFKAIEIYKSRKLSLPFNG